MIFGRIKENLPTMSPLHKKIAQYILDNGQSVGFSSIYKMSEDIGISNATLVRFARSLGMKGYSELRRQLQAEIAHQVNSYEKITSSGLNGLSRNKQRQMFFQNEQENLRKTFENLDNDALDKIVEYIKTSERIFLAGFGLTRHFMGSFEYSLRTTLEKQIIPIYGCVSDYTPSLKSFTSRDCLFLTTFPPYSGEGMHIASFTKERGGAFILITDSSACPFYSFADIVVRCERNSLLLNNSYVGLVAVLQTLVNQASLAQKEESAEERKENQEMEQKGYAVISAYKAVD